MLDFSLSVSIMRTINGHQSQQYVLPVSGFLVKSLADRVLGICLSVFALIDIAYHLSVFTYKSFKAVKKATFDKQTLNFSEAISHLKIAWLFHKVFLLGSLRGFIIPSTVGSLIENNSMVLARNLLLSGNPEALYFHSVGIRLEGINTLTNFPQLDVLINSLAEKDKVIIKDILNKLEEIRNLSKITLENTAVSDVLTTRFNTFLTTFFNRLESSENDSVYLKIFNSVIQRIFILSLNFSVPVLILTNVLNFIATLGIAVLFYFTSDYPTEFTNIVLKRLACVLKINIVYSLKYLMAIPSSITLGLYNPKKFFSLFFSTYCNNSNEIMLQSHEKVMKKIKDLHVNDNLLLPIGSDGHAYNVIVSKLDSNYRVSVISRGDLSHYYHFMNKEFYHEVDYSFDNVPLDFINFYLKSIVAFYDPEVKKNRQIIISELKENKLYLSKDHVNLVAGKLFQKAFESLPKEQREELEDIRDLLLSAHIELEKNIIEKSEMSFFIYNTFHLLTQPKARKKVCESLRKDPEAKVLHDMLSAIDEKIKIERFHSGHIKRTQKIGNCFISTYLGAISFESARNTGDFKDKRSYKKFVLALKEKANLDYGYLLNLDPSIKKEINTSDLIRRTLEKARFKIFK